MHMLTLIEPVEDDRFRAKAGESSGLRAEGKKAEEATRRLTARRKPPHAA